MVEITEIKHCFTEKEYPLKFHELDYNLVLKPAALLNMLQDIAATNADLNGFGYSFANKKNYGWFLIKYHIEFDKYPENTKSILIVTEPKGATKLFAVRDFELYSSDKTQRLGKVTSNWFLIDLSTHKILPPTETIPTMNKFIKNENTMNFKRIIVPEEFTVEEDFKVRFEDIDTNKHANNSNYIIWALEPLPSDFREKNRIKILDILYKKEIQYGQILTSKLSIDYENNISKHLLINKATKEELCALEIEWNKI